ncbi:MAG: DUF697 domain-containing protein [Planctomycetaceae bacterium]|nr:DUF697 domain-containing protein [Planctomycetaceae bacterium]
MPGYTDISPNEPDVTPDYIDDKPAPRAAVAAQTAVMEPPPPPEAPARPEPAASSNHREGECIPNVPDVEPETVAPDRVASAVRPGTAPAAPVEGRAPASPWLRWYLGATVLVVGAFCFFLTSQAISSLAYAATLAPWLRYPLLGILGLSCLAVVVVCAGLVRSWLRLRRMRQVDLAALEELRRRAKSREDGLEHMQAARASLEEYLLAYPLSAARQPVLLGAGLTAEAIEKLARSRDFLVGRSVDSMTWLDDFGRGFQDELDRAARARIKAWSLRAAGCVIASPLPFLDAVLVLTIALKMLRDVCVIYNIRASRSGLLLLLNKAIAAAFIAGVAEQATEIAGGYAAEELSEMVGEGVLVSLGARVAGVVAPKLGEGAVNAFFIHRLGRSAVRMVQPLKPKKG